MNDHDALLEIAELYALGGCSEADRERLAEHVADGCAACEAALRANHDAASQLLLAVEPALPSSHVRERLFARARAGGVAANAPQRRRSVSYRAPIAAAAGVLLIVGLSVFSAVLGLRLAHEREVVADLEEALDYEESISWSLVRQTESERSRRIAIEQRLVGLSRVVSALEAPLARSLALAGQGEFRRAVAKAYIEPESGRLILYAHNLPPVPDGRTYQIWVIVQDRHRSVGLFASDIQGEAKYDAGRLPDLDGPVTVAVTLEPEGGAPQPTGPIVLLGS
jgi:anti-sigma-K factor RskA